MNDITAAAVQFEAAAGDKQANLATMRGFIAEAATRKVDLLVFPECCVTGYWFLRNLTPQALRGLAEPAFTGPIAKELSALSRRHSMTIGAGFVEAADDGRLYNSYLVATPDGGLHRHRKLHAFEHDAISSGDEYTVFDTPHGVRMGVLICYDCNIFENVRLTALEGADVLLAPHQTGGCRTRNPHLMGVIERSVWDQRRENPEAIEDELLGDKGRAWLMRWLPSRAHDNGIFLVFANGIGVDDDEIRTGNAMILDPYGRILAESRKAGDDMVTARLCGSLLPDSTGRAWMQARRPALYAGLAQPTGRERDARQLKFEE
ncbi:MAG: nitrilase-related carbon-nitrogen hydrolase [Bryobacteraceae bacterium]|nr:nitrilase-related carbon-nitrogen hydrolase [Bryobacteraceae bacterium]